MRVYTYPSFITFFLKGDAEEEEDDKEEDAKVSRKAKDKEEDKDDDFEHGKIVIIRKDGSMSELRSGKKARKSHRDSDDSDDSVRAVWPCNLFFCTRVCTLRVKRN
jgi:hypothetical protein